MWMSIIDMFSNIFVSCASWLGGLMEGSGMLSIWLGAVAIWTVYRFLLKPLFGVAGSDSARRKSISGSSIEARAEKSFHGD